MKTLLEISALDMRFETPKGSFDALRAVRVIT